MKMNRSLIVVATAVVGFALTGVAHAEWTCVDKNMTVLDHGETALCCPIPTTKKLPYAHCDKAYTLKVDMKSSTKDNVDADVCTTTHKTLPATAEPKCAKGNSLQHRAGQDVCISCPSPKAATKTEPTPTPTPRTKK